jgi:very-short-patch-repair endonuclease
VDRQKDFPAANARARRLRAAPTSAEAKFRKRLKMLEGFHFRRQVALGPYVFDFGDHGKRLLIELDGGIHNLPEVDARDRIKGDWARSQGYRVVRIPNDYASGDGAHAITAVLAAARAK